MGFVEGFCARPFPSSQPYSHTHQPSSQIQRAANGAVENLLHVGLVVGMTHERTSPFLLHWSLDRLAGLVLVYVILFVFLLFCANASTHANMYVLAQVCMC